MGWPGLACLSPTRLGTAWLSSVSFEFACFRLASIGLALLGQVQLRHPKQWHRNLSRIALVDGLWFDLILFGSAWPRLASLNVARLYMAVLAFVCIRFAKLHLAQPGYASLKQTSLGFASLRFALLRLASLATLRLNLAWLRASSHGLPWIGFACLGLSLLGFACLSLPLFDFARLRLRCFRLASPCPDWPPKTIAPDEQMLKSFTWIKLQNDRFVARDGRITLNGTA